LLSVTGPTLAIRFSEEGGDEQHAEQPRRDHEERDDRLERGQLPAPVARRSLRRCEDRVDR
jgi:hypothetical protein